MPSLPTANARGTKDPPAPETRRRRTRRRRRPRRRRATRRSTRNPPKPERALSKTSRSSRSRRDPARSTSAKNGARAAARRRLAGVRPRLVPRCAAAREDGFTTRLTKSARSRVDVPSPPEPLAAVDQELAERAASRQVAIWPPATRTPPSATPPAPTSRRKVGDAQRPGEVLLRPLRGLQTRGRPEHLRKHVQDLIRHSRVERLTGARLAQPGGLAQDVPRRDTRPLVAPAELGMRRERLRVDAAR